MEDKKKVIDEFLSKLSSVHHPEVDSFTVICKKCGSSDVTIYHGCNYYSYSSYTRGFTDICGLKCKGCGVANKIYSDESCEEPK